MWGWRNWQAWEAGYPPLGAVEYRLYTDCDLLSGEATEGLGPYQLFKTGTFVLTIGTVLPAVVLRANHYIYPALVLGGARGNSLELNIDTLRLVGTVDDKRNELRRRFAPVGWLATIWLADESRSASSISQVSR